jgi:hypothetical protein
LHRLLYDQRSVGQYRLTLHVREYRLADPEHRANAEETKSIREVRYDVRILSDGFRLEYLRRNIVHLPERGIPMETHPKRMKERGSALPTTARGGLKRTPIQGMRAIYG